VYQEEICYPSRSFRSGSMHHFGLLCLQLRTYDHNLWNRLEHFIRREHRYVVSVHIMIHIDLPVLVTAISLFPAPPPRCRDLTLKIKKMMTAHASASSLLSNPLAFTHNDCNSKVGKYLTTGILC